VAAPLADLAHKSLGIFDIEYWGSVRENMLEARSSRLWVVVLTCRTLANNVDVDEESRFPVIDLKKLASLGCLVDRIGDWIPRLDFDRLRR
jgi:hypothetical protein